MSGHAAPEAPITVTSARVPSRAQVGWALVVAAAGIATAAGIAPFAILAAVLLPAALLGLLHSPLIFLCIITALSGVGLGWTDTAALSVAGNNINVNGLQWSLIIATCAAILIRRREIRLPAPLRGWLVLTALAGAAIAWAPDRMEGLKQFLLYAGPIFTALVVAGMAGRRSLPALQMALYIGAALALALGVVTAIGGDVLGGPLDPDGRPLHRALGTFLLPVSALALARLRYGDWRQALVVAAILLATVATQSRAALAAIALIAGLVVLAAGWRVRIAVVSTAVLGFTLAMSYEPLRERVFADTRTGYTARFGVSGRGESAELQAGGLQLSGRGPVWVQTAYHAMRAPWLGHGTGSASLYVAERTRGLAIFPHNEYLRVFHDFGIAGIAALLAAFGTALAGLRRLRRRAVSLQTRELAYAASLSWVGFMFIAIFDNPLGYFVFFTHNVFLLTALAVRSSELDATTPLLSPHEARAPAGSQAPA